MTFSASSVTELLFDLPSPEWAVKDLLGNAASTDCLTLVKQQWSLLDKISIPRTLFVGAAAFGVYKLYRKYTGLAEEQVIVNERPVSAYHEAGHVIIGWLLEHTDSIEKASIVDRIPTDLKLSLHPLQDAPLARVLIDRMRMLLGGYSAERHIFGQISPDAQRDYDEVVKQIMEQCPLGSAELHQNTLESAIWLNADLLLERQNALYNVAELLMKQDIVPFGELYDLLGPPTSYHEHIKRAMHDRCKEMGADPTISMRCAEKLFPTRQRERTNFVHYQCSITCVGIVEKKYQHPIDEFSEHLDLEDTPDTPKTNCEKTLNLDVAGSKWVTAAELPPIDYSIAPLRATEGNVCGTLDTIEHDKPLLPTTSMSPDYATIGNTMYSKLNAVQKSLVDQILYGESSVNSLEICGGSARVFIYECLYNMLRGMGNNVLCAAWTQISASLLPEGRTMASCFKLVPENLNECCIEPNSPDCRFLAAVDVFIFDVSPMPVEILKPIDNFLQKLHNTSNFFGGKTVVIGGDSTIVKTDTITQDSLLVNVNEIQKETDGIKIISSTTRRKKKNSKNKGWR